MRFSSLELAKKLIGFPSITPDQAGCIDFIESLLKENEFQTYKYEFGSSKICNGITTNLYAVIGDNGPNLCFAGHIDVVPPGDLTRWSHPPFEPKEINGSLFGRGAVDMKGAVACALSATLNYLDQHRLENTRLSFLITSDEEGSGEYGTKEILKQIYSDGHQIDFAIVGEPSCDQEIGDIIKIGRRGSAHFTLKVLGQQGHVAYPEKANNPHIPLIKILVRLAEYRLDCGNEFFDPSSLQITSIDTKNPTTNLIPAFSVATFNIRFNTEHTADSLLATIQNIIKSVTDEYELDYRVSASPFISQITDFKNEFANIVKKVTGVTPQFSTSGGTSDARFIKDYCDFLEFGLLNSTAHKIDEFCQINDLQMLVNVYYMAIEKFISSR